MKLAQEIVNFDSCAESCYMEKGLDLTLSTACVLIKNPGTIFMVGAVGSPLREDYNIRFGIYVQASSEFP